VSAESPSVVIIYYSFTNQTARVADSVADALTKRGCRVAKAAIEFADRRYGERFQQLPMHRPIWNITRMLPAQARKKTGVIAIPEEARAGDYDLVIFGSPTWWLTTCMPVRSYLHDGAAKVLLNDKPFAAFSVSRRYWKGNVATIKALGERNGGAWRGETHFLAYGNQVMSMWSWLAFMRHNEPRARSLGVKMPRPNLRDDFDNQATQFADGLADGL
jgi:flavodoxin